jgi:hypothetical protein
VITHFEEGEVECHGLACVWVTSLRISAIMCSSRVVWTTAIPKFGIEWSLRFHPAVQFYDVCFGLHCMFLVGCCGYHLCLQKVMSIYCALCCSIWFIFLNSLNSLNNPWNRCNNVLISRWQHWRIKRSNNLPMVTQQVSELSYETNNFI